MNKRLFLLLLFLLFYFTPQKILSQSTNDTLGSKNSENSQKNSPNTIKNSDKCDENIINASVFLHQNILDFYKTSDNILSEYLNNEPSDCLSLYSYRISIYRFIINNNPLFLRESGNIRIIPNIPNKDSSRDYLGNFNSPSYYNVPF